MGCDNCGGDAVRAVIVRALVRALERAGHRDVQALPRLKDIVDGAEREIEQAIARRHAGSATVA